MDRKQTKTTSKKATIRTQFNLNYNGSKGEQNTLPSMTQPDMTLSVKDLLNNHSRSSNVQMKDPQYFDQEIPVFDDITQQIEYKEELKSKLKDAELAANEEAKANKNAKLKAQKLKKEQDLKDAKKLLENEQKPSQNDD